MGIAIRDVEINEFVAVEVLSTEETEAFASNIGPIKTIEGERGEPFKYEDFTPEQLENLRGPQGIQGPQGEKGPVGPSGPQGEKGADGVVGKDGKSAYEYAKEGGFTGTEEEFAEVLSKGGEIEAGVIITKDVVESFKSFGIDLAQQVNATRTSMPIDFIEKGDYEKVRIDSVYCYATESGTIRFDLYKLEGGLDGGILTYSATLGEVNAAGRGIAELELANGFHTELEKFCIIAVSQNSIIGWGNYGGVDFNDYFDFADGNYYTDTTRNITVKKGFEGYPVIGSKWFKFNVKSVEDAVNSLEEKINKLEQSGGLPEVTASDAGKFLRVSSEGKWVSEAVVNAEEESF